MAAWQARTVEAPARHTRGSRGSVVQIGPGLASISNFFQGNGIISFQIHGCSQVILSLFYNKKKKHNVHLNEVKWGPSPLQLIWSPYKKATHYDHFLFYLRNMQPSFTNTSARFPFLSILTYHSTTNSSFSDLPRNIIQSLKLKQK